MRDCRGVCTVLKCSNGSAEQKSDFGGTSGTTAADPLGGRIAAAAAVGGAFETGGPQPGGGSSAGGARRFAREERGRFELDGTQRYTVSGGRVHSCRAETPV